MASIEWFAEEAKRTCGDVLETPDKGRRFMVGDMLPLFGPHSMTGAILLPTPTQVPGLHKLHLLWPWGPVLLQVLRQPVGVVAAITPWNFPFRRVQDNGPWMLLFCCLAVCGYVPCAGLASTLLKSL